MIEKTEPRQNSNDANKKWNFHFILGMEGELVQFWVFGPEQKTKEMSSKTLQEEYYLFWGLYSIRECYSSKFKSTNDWGVYLQSNCNKFGRVIKSRKYHVLEDSKSEDRELFAEKFKPAPRKGVKIVKKKKEHNKLDSKQPKITSYGIRTRSGSGTSFKTENEDKLYISSSTKVRQQQNRIVLIKNLKNLKLKISV